MRKQKISKKKLHKLWKNLESFFLCILKGTWQERWTSFQLLVLDKSVIIKQGMMGHNSTPYILYQAHNVQSPHLAAHLSHLWWRYIWEPQACRQGEFSCWAEFLIFKIWWTRSREISVCSVFYLTLPRCSWWSSSILLEFSKGLLLDIFIFLF